MKKNIKRTPNNWIVQFISVPARRGTNGAKVLAIARAKFRKMSTVDRIVQMNYCYWIPGKNEVLVSVFWCRPDGLAPEDIRWPADLVGDAAE